MAAKTWLCLPNKENNHKNNNNDDNSKSKNATNIINNISLINLTLLLIILFAGIALTSTSQTSQPQRQAENTLINDEIEHEQQHSSEHDDANKPHSRKKRLIWITDDGRLALPPGTSLTFTPTIALPLVRHPPEGFFSNMSISFPVTIDFDKLGLTDNQNPLGDLPPIFARSFGHAAGQMVGNYVARYLHYKKRRDLHEQNTASMATANAGFHIKHEPGRESVELPALPERFKHIFHGGERVMLYGVVEDFLTTFGMNGKACLLRTICEIHSRDLNHFGVFGEMVKLFLTVTKSPFADLLPEYVKAQEIGEGRIAPGECYPYHKECPKSIFKAMQNHKYSKQQNSEYHEAEVEEIGIHLQLPRKQEHQKHKLKDIDLSLNEITKTTNVLPQHSLSM